MAPMIHCEGAAGRAAGPASKSRGWKTASVVLPLANFIKQLKSSSYLGAAAPRRYHLVLGKTIRSWFIIEIVFNVVLSFQGIYWIDSFLREIIFELTLPHHRNQFNYISVLWRGGGIGIMNVFSGDPLFPLPFSELPTMTPHRKTQKRVSGTRLNGEEKQKDLWVHSGPGWMFCEWEKVRFPRPCAAGLFFLLRACRTGKTVGS